MKRLIIVVMLFYSVSTSAQEKLKKDFNLDFYGFVRNEFFIDTYKGLDAAHELFYLVPLYVGKDANGDDINGQASANLAAFASRMGTYIHGPDIFGAKTGGNIEFDFGGIVKSEPTLFRIRKAYMWFNWEKTKLTVGQDWHPFWGGGVFPSVAGLNTGAPFQAFNRSPQLRYDIIIKAFTCSATAVYELQYNSVAFESSVFSSPTQAARNAVLPELVLSAEFNNADFTVGAGVSFKRIKPRMTVTGTAGKFNTNEYLGSTSFMGYLKYKTDKLMLTAKGYLGQNMTHLTFLSGYGVATKDVILGKETYTPYNTYTALLNFVYGKKWQAGVMFGLGGNLGTDDALYNDGSENGIITGLLPNVQGIARIAPHLALNLSKIRLVAEYEMTSAEYGIGTFDFTDGLYADSHKTTNNRLIVMMMYFF